MKAFFLLLFIPLSANAIWGFGESRAKGDGEFIFRVSDSMSTTRAIDAFKACKKDERGSNADLAIELYECVGVKPYISTMKLYAFEGVLFSIEVYFTKSKDSNDVYDGLKAKYGEPTLSRSYKAQTPDDYVALGDSAAYGQLIAWQKKETHAELLATGLICANSSGQPTACGWAAKKLSIYDLPVSKKWDERKAAAEKSQGDAAKNRLGF